MKALLVLALLVCAAAAESIRETETMDPNGLFGDIMESSGSLPDDEDLIDYYEDVDSVSEEDEGSGSSGDGEDDDDDDDDEEDDDVDGFDDLESTLDTPISTMGNKIPENNFRDSKSDIDVDQYDNDIIPKKNVLPEAAEPSNEISMASTANNFFSKTEVIVALVAGSLVGLLFAIFIIVLLVMRIRKNKGDLAYDTVKKPIYKKAPTVEA